MNKEMNTYAVALKNQKIFLNTIKQFFNFSNAWQVSLMTNVQKSENVSRYQKISCNNEPNVIIKKFRSSLGQPLCERLVD